MELERIDCIFCGAIGTRPYHAERGYQAVSCLGCGLVFVTPRPTEAAMKHLYEGQETKVDLARQIRNVEAATAEARRSLDLIARYRPTGRILEIGCAAGYFLREAERRGYTATGVEITRQFVDFARGVLGLDAREGTLTGLDLPRGGFDIIYHRNVLSHLGHPLASFHRMRELLSPSGLMVFQTGNVAELPPERWEGTEELDLPDHLFHYSERTIRLLLERTGFAPLTVERYALVLHDPWIRALAAHLGPRLAGRRRAPEAASPPPPFVPPTAAPPPRPLRAIEAHLNQLMTYDIGAAARSEGRRCTLKVVARVHSTP
jgi:SAM-dependent methyltransferase